MKGFHLSRFKITLKTQPQIHPTIDFSAGLLISIEAIHPPRYLLPLILPGGINSLYHRASLNLRLMTENSCFYKMSSKNGLSYAIFLLWLLEQGFEYYMRDGFEKGMEYYKKCEVRERFSVSSSPSVFAVIIVKFVCVFLWLCTI
jgi:hypothetical protein